ncbi:MAG: hypothetical protein JSV86_05880 [Gemmatimonadota bacterium]|nr:MAG: hypothetical protein JSV86_05880 [Gemmatimonadota bacterium]
MSWKRVTLRTNEGKPLPGWRRDDLLIVPNEVIYVPERRLRYELSRVRLDGTETYLGTFNSLKEAKRGSAPQ